VKLSMTNRDIFHLSRCIHSLLWGANVFDATLRHWRSTVRFSIYPYLPSKTSFFQQMRERLRRSALLYKTTPWWRLFDSVSRKWWCTLSSFRSCSDVFGVTSAVYILCQV